MKCINKEFSSAEYELLKKLKGAQLHSIEAVLVAPPDISWNTVRLHCEALDIDINNYLAHVVLGKEDSAEEIGFFGACSCGQGDSQYS